MQTTIVCLANSIKHGGRCVAGKDVTVPGGRWIRPISARPTADLALPERSYADGTEPRLLDVLSIPCLRSVPHAHQTENVLIDPQRRWQKLRRMSWEELAGLVDQPDSLWMDGHSTKYGRNDRVPASGLATITSSLALIRPEKFLLKVSQPYLGAGSYERVVRGSFELGRHCYDLRVTDIPAKNMLLDRPDGDYPVVEPYLLCVSLAETFTDGFAYKVIASVITPGGIHVR